MKKIIGLLICVSIILVSCNNVEVSEENFKLVGQNIASTLENYHTPEEAVTPDVDLNETDNKINNGNDSNVNNDLNNNTSNIEELSKEQNDGDEGEEITGVATEEEIDKVKSEAKVVDQLSDENFTITYKSYEVAETYPNKPDDEPYAYVEALDNTKLLVLTFDFTNKKDIAQDLSYIAQTTSFKLLVKNKYLFAPINTLMENDIVAGIFQLDPGETREAVLVFQIQDDAAKNLSSIMLLATRPNKKELLEV